MEYFKFLFLLCLVVGCNTKPITDQTSTTETGSTEPVAQWLTLEGKDSMPHIVLVTGDEEYRSEEALPQLAKILSQRHGFNCTVLFAQDPKYPGIIDPNYLHNIPGLEQLESADLMVIFTRFRALPDDQMKHIERYVKSGRPIFGIRTATHAFEFEDVEFEVDLQSSYLHYGNNYEEADEWEGGFGRVVLGEKWISHHGEHGEQSSKGIIAPNAQGHPILNGIQDGDIWGPTDVYGVRLPLPGDAQPLVLGQVVNREGEYDEEDDSDPLLGMRPTDKKLPGLVQWEDDEDEEIEIDQNDPMMPIAWTKTYQIPGGQAGKAFTSTIGASTDLLTEGTRRMMVNAVFWLLDLKVPASANVELVGTYQPSRFAFYEHEYWDEKKVKVADLE